MKCEFSEFTYGYACMREAEDLLRAVYPPARVPIQPSLLTEATVGYDAAFFQVDYTLFLQFKRSDYISRRHSTPCVQDGDHEDRCTWIHLGRHHHRFTVDTGSNQFRALRRYDDEIAHGNRRGDVLYVAPRFHTETELSGHYFTGNVLGRSVLVRPRSIPADGEVHRIARTVDGGGLLVLSEPTVIDAVEWSTIADDERLRAATLSARDRPAPTVLDLVTELESAVWERQLGLSQARQGEAPPMRRLQDAARILGGEILVVGRDQRAPSRQGLGRADDVLG